MPGILGGSVMQVVWEGSCFGQTIRHVRTWGVNSNGVITDELIGIAQQFAGLVAPGGSADFTTPYLACMSSSYTLKTIVAKVVWPKQGRFFAQTIVGGTPGTRGAAVTANLQAGIHVWTGLGGRKQIASYKIGPLATADCAAGNVVGALQAALATYAGTFTLVIPQPSPNAIGWVPVIFHRRRKLPDGTYTVPDWDKIIGSQQEDEVRVKSTRTVGRGE